MSDACGFDVLIPLRLFFADRGHGAARRGREEVSISSVTMKRVYVPRSRGPARRDGGWRGGVRASDCGYAAN